MLTSLELKLPLTNSRLEVSWLAEEYGVDETLEGKGREVEAFDALEALDLHSSVVVVHISIDSSRLAYSQLCDFLRLIGLIDFLVH